MCFYSNHYAAVNVLRTDLNRSVSVTRLDLKAPAPWRSRFPACLGTEVDNTTAFRCDCKQLLGKVEEEPARWFAVGGRRFGGSASIPSDVSPWSRAERGVGLRAKNARASGSWAGSECGLSSLSRNPGFVFEAVQVQKRWFVCSKNSEARPPCRGPRLVGSGGVRLFRAIPLIQTCVYYTGL